MWMGQGEAGGTIEIDKSLLKQKIEPAMVTAVSNLFTVGMLSREAALELLQEEGLFPRTFDMQKEIAKTEAEGLMLADEETEAEGEGGDSGIPSEDS
jgi:hypothetical protein